MWLDALPLPAPPSWCEHGVLLVTLLSRSAPVALCLFSDLGNSHCHRKTFLFAITRGSPVALAPLSAPLPAPPVSKRQLVATSHARLPCHRPHLSSCHLPLPMFLILSPLNPVLCLVQTSWSLCQWLGSSNHYYLENFLSFQVMSGTAFPFLCNFQLFCS